MTHSTDDIVRALFHLVSKTFQNQPGAPAYLEVADIGL
jgi:hypothetical protein